MTVPNEWPSICISEELPSVPKALLTNYHSIGVPEILCILPTITAYT
jgi:hypothetical protein